ncbi:MAG: hypothetical protein IPK85_15270 [Gemmatimonadetes bacterium]|nr:hypothetical protein [Gemmatimonadota bacterium]
MSKNEKSSGKMASLAGKILEAGEKKATPQDAKKLAASVLTQAPDKQQEVALSESALCRVRSMTRRTAETESS